MKKKKRCSKCMRSKPSDQFYKNKTKKFGLSNYCIECDKARSKKYRSAIPDIIYQRDKAYRNANPEKAREMQRKVNQRHKEQLTDSYIANKILHKKVDNCTKEEIHACREKILLNRELKKELKNKKVL